MERRTEAPGRSLRSRLLLTGIAVMAPVLLGAGVWVLLLTRSTGDYQRLATEIAQETRSSALLLDHLNDAGSAGRDYLVNGGTSAHLLFQEAAVRVDRGLADAEGYDESGERIALVGIARPWRDAKRGLRDRDEDSFVANVDAAAAGLERLMTNSQVELVDELAATDKAARFHWLLGLAGVALALLIAALLARRLARKLAEPLEQLAQAARFLGSGNLGHRVAIDSSPEFTEVGATFNAMAEALQQQHEELERHAFADSLTGLANRALFEDRTRHALERISGAGERVAVLVLDIDAFKLVNDGLGHACGDALLRRAAERLSAALRPSDTLARLGSDEFAVLLETVRGPDDALGAAERLRRALDDPFVLRTSEVKVTASVGIALSTDETADAVELLRRADVAMYRVKQHGRNSCEFFDPGMDDQASERLEMANALRRAVERDELVVHYQPIFDLDTGEIRAAEALLRWNRPGHGLVPPLDFIPLAERTGEIVALGAWVLRAACAEAREWERAGIPRVPVTVNVSARQLLDSRFESVVAEALAATGLDPAGLILEVTESSVMQDIEATTQRLERISATGVSIALDDFGEGYSSLGQLRQLPIDMLKIARPFVGGLMDDGADAALLRGIIELGRSLGLRLVAEGVEHPEQQAILRAFDCQLGQGFLFARPLEAEQLRELLSRLHAPRALP